MARPDPERVWLGFAQAAAGGVMSVNLEIDPALTTWEKANARLADDCAAFADEMLERWKLRYDDADPTSTRGVRPSDLEPKPTARADADW